MADGDVHTSLSQVLAIAWVYRVHLNAGWLWTVGTSIESKHGFQNYAVCTVSASIWHDNIGAAHRRSGDMVEDASDAVDIVRIATGKHKNQSEGKACGRMTSANFILKKMRFKHSDISDSSNSSVK